MCDLSDSCVNRIETDVNDEDLVSNESKPEFMTKKQLIERLKEANINLENIETNNGYEYYNLIDLYNRVLLPFPQRSYANKRKSIILKISQNECNKRYLRRKLQQKDNNEELLKNINLNKNKSIDSSKPLNQKLDKQNGKRIIEENADKEWKRRKISWP